MDRLITLVAVLSLLGSPVSAADAVAQTPQIQVYFSPGGGCTAAIVQALDRAKTTIRVQAYAFTSPQIAQALVSAHRRGVSVEVILDRSNRTASYSIADFTAHAGIPSFIDTAHAIAHNKVIVIDSDVVITGSFNFTKAAEEKNAENLLVIRDRELATRYAANWSLHRAHSAPYLEK